MHLMEFVDALVLIHLEIPATLFLYPSDTLANKFYVVVILRTNCELLVQLLDKPVIQFRGACHE